MKIKYIWYRIRQFCFSAFMYLAPLRQAKVIRGVGSIYQIPEMLKKDGKKKVLIVTTPGFIRRGSLEKLFQTFEKNKVEYAVFSKIQPDPDTDFHKLGIGEKIEELEKKDFEELAKRAVKEGNPTYPVPVIWEKKDFLDVMEKIV